MQESLRRWWWWAWVCLAVATGQEHCQVLDLTLEPSAYPLPTNITLRPSARDWQVDLTLQEKGAPPAACVRLKGIKSTEMVMLFEGPCVRADIRKLNYLPSDSVLPHAWTTLALDVRDNTVLVTASNRAPIALEAGNMTLPRDTLQVTMTQDVEAAVGCHVNCPLYNHSSEGSDVKKKVGEWRRDKLHFYFRPWTPFDKVHYEVVCNARKETEFRHGVDIQPGKEGAKGAWHLVELDQQENKAKVYLNKKLLEEVQLPDSCTTNMHVIWAVGDAFFGFDCKPKEVVQGEGDPFSEVTPDNIMHPGASAGITAVVFLVLIVIGLALYKCRHRLQLRGKAKIANRSMDRRYDASQTSLSSAAMGIAPTIQFASQRTS